MLLSNIITSRTPVLRLLFHAHPIYYSPTPSSLRVSLSDPLRLSLYHPRPHPRLLAFTQRFPPPRPLRRALVHPPPHPRLRRGCWAQSDFVKCYRIRLHYTALTCFSWVTLRRWRSDTRLGNKHSCESELHRCDVHGALSGIRIRYERWAELRTVTMRHSGSQEVPRTQTRCSERAGNYRVCRLQSCGTSRKISRELERETKASGLAA